MKNRSAKMQDLPWTDLQYILAVARAGSLAGAARRLRVNESTVARHLARPAKELAVVARRIGHLDYGVYGRAGEDGAALPFIGHDDSMGALPQARWMAGRAESPALTVNDAQAMLAGAKAGLGKCLLPIAAARREPDLVRLDDGPAALSREIWLMVHPGLRRLARIRVVMDWLVAVAGDLPRS